MKNRLFLLLASAILLPNAALADFVVNNIRYAPLNDKEVKVTGGTVSGSRFVIPETVYDEDEDIEYTVTEIGEDAFALFGADGARITSGVVLPKTIKRIDDRAFNYQSFSTINLPEGLTYIGKNAFEVNRNLHSIVIPSTCTEIGTEAFSRSGLSYIYMLGDSPCRMGSDVFMDVSGTDENQKKVGFYIVVKPSKLDAYKNALNDYADMMTDELPLSTTGEVPVYAGLNVSPTTGITTFCSSMAIDIKKAEGLKVYYVKGVADNVIDAEQMPGSVIPACMGVILNGEKDKTYMVSIAEDQEDILSVDNMLVGVIARTSLVPTDGDKKNYVLNDTQFTLFDNSDQWRSYIRQNSAYLSVDASVVNSDILILKLNDDVTGVISQCIPQSVGTGTYYNLNGTIVANPEKGIYIYNGHKVVIK